MDEVTIRAELKEQYCRVVNLAFHDLQRRGATADQARGVLEDWNVPEAVRRVLEQRDVAVDCEAAVLFCKDQVWDTLAREHADEPAEEES